MDVQLVDLREAYLDHRVRSATIAPGAAGPRLDLTREMFGLAYDNQLVLQAAAEMWTDDEPTFTALLICPKCRQSTAAVGLTFAGYRDLIADLRARDHGGPSAMWEYIRTQMAAECGLN